MNRRKTIEISTLKQSVNSLLYYSTKPRKSGVNATFPSGRVSSALQCFIEKLETNCINK